MLCIFLRLPICLNFAGAQARNHLHKELYNNINWSARIAIYNAKPMKPTQRILHKLSPILSDQSTTRFNVSVSLHHLYDADTHYVVLVVLTYVDTLRTETYMCWAGPNITMCVGTFVGSLIRTILNMCHISLHALSGTEPAYQSKH